MTLNPQTGQLNPLADYPFDGTGQMPPQPSPNAGSNPLFCAGDKSRALNGVSSLRRNHEKIFSVSTTFLEIDCSVSECDCLINHFVSELLATLQMVLSPIAKHL